MILERIEEGITGAVAADRINASMVAVEAHDVTLGDHDILLGNHTTDIGALDVRIIQNDNDITANLNAININTNDIGTLIGKVGALEVDVADNSAAIIEIVETVNGITDFLDDGITAVLDEPVIVTEDGNEVLTYSSNGNVVALGDNTISTVVNTTPTLPFKVREDNEGVLTEYEVYHTGNVVSTDSGNYLSLGDDGGLKITPLYTGAGVSQFLYRYESDIDNVVDNGKITMNTNDGVTATLLHFSDTDDSGVSLTWFFESMEAGDWFNLYERDNGDNFIAFDVVSKPTLDVETWTVEVVHFNSTITEFNDRERLSVLWRQGGSSNVATQVYVDSEVAQLRTEIQELRDYVDSLHPAP